MYINIILFIYILDGCNGIVYPLLEKLIILCQAEAIHTSARTKCEEMGGMLLELETAEKLDNFITTFNSYNSRYVGNIS